MLFGKSTISLKIVSLNLKKQHSTNLAITYLHETILEECDANKSVCEMFLNFANAFDSSNHKILLDKLEHYGIRGIAHNLFCSY